MEEKEELSVLIADDHAIVKYGLSLILLEMYVDVKCFDAATYDEVYNLLKREHVDLLILDIAMPGGHNMKSVEDLKMSYPELKILIFSAYQEHVYAGRYLKAGADGFLHKDTPETKIKKVISAIVSGQEGLRSTNIRTMSFSNSIEMLSDRELDVAKMLSLGMGNLEIANALDLQMSTVSTYKKRVFEKLGVLNIPELIQKLAI